MVGHGSGDHSGRFYKVWVTRTWHIIMQMQWHMKQIPIWVVDYLYDELKKISIPQVSKRFNELVNTYAILYNSMEQVRLNMKDMQIDNEWRAENLTSVQEQASKKQSIHRDMH